MSIKPFFEKQIPNEHDLNGASVHDVPLLDRIFKVRGITDKEQLNHDISGLLSPFTMMGMDKACEILIKHIKAQSMIVVVGDYDCDGATSTSIAVEGLKLLGAKNVKFLVPDRMKHGYGLSPAVVDIAAREKPDLIVTVDNGIASFDGADAVKALEHNCELLVTDHHLAAERGLPNADVIVNPNQPDCPFESKSIAGCGVMFYVIMGLRATMRRLGTFAELGMIEPSLNQLIDLVALGTVADVVPLDKNNRILVNTGLKQVNSGFMRPGIKALLEIGGRKIGDIVSSDFGFAVGPRLNAAGRLDDMSLGIQCLLEQNPAKATEIATMLDEFNVRRKEIELEMLEEAVSQWDTFDTDLMGVCLHKDDWHEGVVGIVASRIKDRLNRPVICFSDTESANEIRNELKIAEQMGKPEEEILKLKEDLMESEIKGSARSVQGVHLKHVLDEINKSNPEALSKFGGHSMAAGLSLKIKHFAFFREKFNSLVANLLTQEDIRGKVDVDIKDMPQEWMTIENAELIRRVSPWGQEFLQPLFSGKFDVVSLRVLKDKHLKLQLKAKDQFASPVFEAIAFNKVDKGVVPIGDQVEASFSLDINEWRGNRNLQLMIDHIQDENYESNKPSLENETRGPVSLDGLLKRRSVSSIF